MDPVEDNKITEGPGAHINLALELDENIPGYEKFTEVPIKNIGMETKDVVDFPKIKSPRSEIDESNIDLTNNIIFEDLPAEKEANGVGKVMEKVQTVWEMLESLVTKNKSIIKMGLYILFALLYAIYFAGAISFSETFFLHTQAIRTNNIETFLCNNVTFIISWRRWTSVHFSRN